MEMTAETLFCIKYLLEHGIDSSNFDTVADLIRMYEVPDFDMVKKENDDFFTSLAKSMRELWPPGEKNGKYPWRDSVKNIVARLKILWKERKLKDYSVDECLSVARRYLLQFENDVKYMKTLKYFIWKNNKVVATDGKITYTFSSQFADMLEGKSAQDAIENEWESLLNDVSIGEGELI